MNDTSLAAFEEKIQEIIKETIDELTMIAVFDRQWMIRYANENFADMTEEHTRNIIGKPLEDYISADLSSVLVHTVEEGRKWSGEIRQKRSNHTYFWVEASIFPIGNSGQDDCFLLIQRDITERKENEYKLERLAYVDPLTGLPNRNQIKKWIQEDACLVDKDITVLFIDIDRFKTINDNFGHDIGDQVLITIADRLRDSTGEDGFLFRYDGEEFIMLLKNQSREDINTYLNQILESIREPIKMEDLDLLVTASIGISSGQASYEKEDVLKTIEDLIKKADMAMSLAKKQGKNRFHFHSRNQTRELDREYQIEIEVREALERDEFSLVYQPLINLKTNKIVGVESLLRWDNRLLGKVSPGEFIPMLEECGLIVPIGKWILKTVSEQMKNWQEQGLFLQRVSVNVSPVQFRDPNFVADLKTILDEVQLDASYLELEITEGTLLDIENSAKKLHDLQELGVKVSIDDFGTGYSSLSYLKQLPIDTLKIDKSFIDDLDTDGKIIVNTIISMGKNLQFRVIAEGIENSDQFKYLQQQQCHEGQGYFFSRPVESDKIEELYHSLQ